MTALLRLLLKFSRLIDAFNERLGKALAFLVLITVLISAGNAIVRKLLHTSSNAYLEIQWYLFGAMFLLGAGYTLLKNGHVRIDILNDRFSERTRAWIDLLGTLLFLLPLCALVIYYVWPRFLNAWELQETSSDAGGLIRWPVWLLIPLGFLLLALQGVSHAIKHGAFLMRLAPFPNTKASHNEQESLIEDLRRDREEPR